MQLNDLSAVTLIDLFRQKRLSPLQYWDHLEQTIAAWEPKIAALYAYDPAAARAQAIASTERWQRGEPKGPLDGVPVTLKELIATAGLPIPQGSAATTLIPAVADAPPAARLKEAGAILFAKTTVPDLAMLSSGLSSFHGVTRNPWDLASNPGGSSAGAAAAGAAGYGPIHIGTDIGGSVRLPAGWCCLVGFKPSLGRIPIDPYFVGRCAGPLTRTVADAALAMQILSAPDSRDAMSLPPAAIDWTDLTTDVRGLRLGLMLDAGVGLAAEPEIVAATEHVAKLFEQHGAIVETVGPVLTRAMLDGIDDFWRARAWNDLRGLEPERLAKLLPYIRDWAAVGETLPGWRVAAGFNQTMAMRRAAADLFGRVDAVLSPTNPIVAYPADQASPTQDPARPFEHIAFTLPWNMSEQPAISINAGFSASGMPIGVQLVGPRFDDLGVLRLAAAVEAWLGKIDRWPECPLRTIQND
jgi:aspartyl-tRNA(Asn)/glutamyl-tRNA(Gln) amidotransferase subunit A